MPFFVANLTGAGDQEFDPTFAVGGFQPRKFPEVFARLHEDIVLSKWIDGYLV